MKWQYGIQYDVYPVDVVLGRPQNKDGTVTRLIWQPQAMNEEEGRLWAIQVMDSPAPREAKRKKAVRRQVGEIEDAPTE